MTLNKACDQLGKSIVLSLGEPILDRNVLAFDETLSTKTIPKGGEQFLAFVSGVEAKIADRWKRGLVCVCNTRRVNCRQHEKRDQTSQLHWRTLNITRADG